MAEKYFACDPAVVSVQLFLLADEQYRDGRDANGNALGGGWQSGLVTAGGSGVSAHKSAYSQVASDFAAGRDACSGSMISWTPKGSSSGGTGGTGGTGDSSTSATFGNLNDLFILDFVTALQQIAVAEQEATPFVYSGVIQKFLASTQTSLDTLLASMQPGTSLTMSGSLIACNGVCDIRTILRGFMNVYFNNLAPRSLSKANAKLTKVASFTTTLKPGQKASAKLKSALKKNMKAPVGSYYFVVALKNKADATTRYGFAVKLRSVQAAAKPTTPKRKK
jgi:hypothetical protein